ncbi:hypothetical protein RHGRI_002833 [Rhododendron griersonianum]|uniref:Cupin type-1 domain-containing protein n=1 Tax=Rhododendron griersonianum TaxID=479676 RepID=A0AAV6LQG2_9ERIC|nr:hypothetical protein RHGRI_002833 [Rhododendron griersonianum]
MAMAKLSMLSVFLCFLVLFHFSVAYGQQGSRRGQRSPFGEQGQRGQRRQGDCQLNNLNAQEPQHRLQAEAGVTEFWDFDDDQFRCAGVAACRNIIQPRGLFLPAYTNAPTLIYILQKSVLRCTFRMLSSLACGVILDGRGIQGVMMSGCPETYQSSQQQSEGGGRREGGGQRFRDQHQKIRRFREGDVIALPAGVAHWCYNDGDSELVAVIMEDTGNHQNQLDNNPRILRPSRSREEQEEEERGRESGRRANGLEETICSARLVENINDPSRADFFNPRAGRLTTLNNFNLPILNFLRLSAEKGVLYRDAFMPPHYRLNAHCVLYATRGEAQMQIVDNRGQSVFNDRIQEGQMVVVPQNFVVSKQAGNEGFEWVALKTHENAMFSTLAGRTSALRAMPVDVVANAYQISRDEARRLKMNREEAILMEPRQAGRIRSVVA